MKRNRNKNICTLGEKVRFFRLRKRVSQLDLEINSELATGTVSRIERNLIDPTKQTLFKIAKYLELDSKEIAYLFEINLYVLKIKNEYRNQNNS